jgi:hypothetical protein
LLKVAAFAGTCKKKDLRRPSEEVVENWLTEVGFFDEYSHCDYIMALLKLSFQLGK